MGHDDTQASRDIPYVGAQAALNRQQSTLVVLDDIPPRHRLLLADGKARNPDHATRQPRATAHASNTLVMLRRVAHLMF